MSDYKLIKEELSLLASEYKGELEDTIKKSLDNLGDNTKNLLIISGSLISAYLLVRAIIKKDKSAEEEVDGQNQNFIYQRTEPSFVKKLSDRVMEQALLFLLSVAKQKLVDYLNEKLINKDDTESDSK